MACLDLATADRIAHHQVGREELGAIEGHAAGCEACARLLEGLDDAASREESVPTSAATIPRASNTARVQADVLPRGTLLGRYVVLDSIASGGMGSIYAAYDPELDRKIAIKVLRAQAGMGSATGGQQQSRLRREALALAKLAHPHVVAIYDVGEWGDRVFLAMELVEGVSLRGWLHQKPRDARAVLDVLVPAGEGLAAAHAAGLVHRDFKPDNVLVGKDGRVRVADFGLVRPKGEAEATSEPLPLLEIPKAAPIPLTEIDAVIGTRGYLAPEQYRGHAADARSDQFAFAVTLHECLLGRRPFSSERPEFLAGPELGQHWQVQARGEIPPRVFRSLARGLALRPEDRFPSMNALLAELKVEPRALMHRRWAVAGAAALAVVVIGLSALGLRGPARRCQGAEQRLVGVWDLTRQRAVHDAFLKTNQPYAATVWAQVASELGAYAGSWTQQRTEACQATQVRGEQPESVLALRMACLDRRLSELESLTSVLTRVDDEVLASSTQAVAALIPLSQCADLERLLAPVKPPANVNVGAAVDQARKQLADGKALLDAGKYREGQALAQQLVDRARVIGYAPLQAEALNLLGWLQLKSGDPVPAARTLIEGELRAEASNDDALATEISTRVAQVFYQQTSFRPSSEWVEHGEATLQRMGGNDVLQARLLEVRAQLLGAAGKYLEGAPLLERALGLKERALGPSHLELADTLSTLSKFTRDPADADKALVYAQRALALVEHAYGPDHPETARALTHVEQIYRDTERYSEALELAKRALAIQERALRPDHLDIGVAHWGMGSELINKGDLEGALEHFQRALPFYQAAYGASHLLVGSLRGNIASLEFDLGQEARALEDFQAALVIDEKALGEKDAPKLIHSLTGVATVLTSLHRFAEADRSFQRAFAVGRRDDPKNADLVFPLEASAQWSLAERRYGEAESRLLEAERMWNQRIAAGSVTVALIEVERAEVLLAQGRARESLTVASAARAVLERKLGPEDRRLADALTFEGEALLDSGDATSAVALLERAAALRDRFHFRESLVARTRRSLARAVAAVGPSEDRSRRVARLPNP